MQKRNKGINIVSESNIEQFNEITGIVFAYLYESFPVARDLTIDDFTHENVSDYYVRSSLHSGLSLGGHARMVQQTIQWLVIEGYLRTKLQSSGGFRGCVLTSKGLETLNLIPDSLDSSIGEKLVTAVKEESKTAVRSLIQKALAYGVTIAAS